jgi:hypothetical protein
MIERLFKTIILDIIHCPSLLETLHFRGWLCFHLDMSRIGKKIQFVGFPGGATVKLWTPTVYRGQGSETIYIRDWKIT